MVIIARAAAFLAITAILSVWVIAPGPPRAAEEPAFTEAQKSALDALIRDYIMRHPEVVMESLGAMQERERLAKERQQMARVAQLTDAIERDPGDPVLGNPDGDVTVVEFFDYQCGFCKRMLEPMMNLAREDRGVRIVMKELPILGPESVLAARASLAAGRQGKYEAFHLALMQIRGRLSEPAILQTALELGLNAEQLRADMDDPAAMAQIQRNRELAEALSIRGTPAFVIGGTLVPGAISAERLRTLVAEARARG